MEKWLDVIKSNVATTTYASYVGQVRNIIAPYFRETKITLEALEPKDIQEFYIQELKRVSASSVIHYHANIHKELKFAHPDYSSKLNSADAMLNGLGLG